MPAYEYPLLLKQLLLTPLAQNTPHEIVYGKSRRYNYPTLREHIGRLGSALSRLGVKAGDTVAMMDWDSHRYLECYFAVPMLGAVLQTVNVRLSTEQVVYCLNHAEASLLICNLDFLPMFEAMRHDLKTIEKIVWISDAGPIPEGPPGQGEYEDFIAWGDPGHEFADFDENTRATLFYTTRYDGFAQRRDVHAPPARAAYPCGAGDASALARKRVHADHANVPRARVGNSVCGDARGVQASVSWALTSRGAFGVDPGRARQLHALCAHDLANDPCGTQFQRRRLNRPTHDHRRFGASAGAV